MIAPVVATTLVLLAGNASATKCVDDASYVSSMGLPCSAYAQLECDGFRHVGWTDQQTDELVKKCPRSCRASFCDETDSSTSIRQERSLTHVEWAKVNASGNTVQSRENYRMIRSEIDKKNLGGTAGGDGINAHLIPQSYCPSGWDDSCKDDPYFHTHVGFHCEAHATLDCTMFGSIGFTEQQVYDLINSCPCSCQVECGTWTMSPTHAPTQSPTISALPSHSPTSSPSSRPTVTASASPSSPPTSRPTNAPSEQPSQEPSVTASSEPSQTASAKPSVTASSSPSSPPTGGPTLESTPMHSSQPSASPSAHPTSIEISELSAVHSSALSSSPSSSPTLSTAPSSLPSYLPTNTPTISPSAKPPVAHSASPSSLPSQEPTASPTNGPTKSPSPLPSASPTPASVEMATVFTIPLELNNDITGTDAKAIQDTMKTFLQLNQRFGADNAGANVTIEVSDVHVDEIIPRSSSSAAVTGEELEGPVVRERRMKKSSSSSRKSKQGGEQDIEEEVMDIKADGDIGKRIESSPTASIVTSEVVARVRISCNVYPYRPLEVDTGFQFVPRLLGGFAAGDFESFLYQLASSSSTFASPASEEEQIIGESTNNVDVVEVDEIDSDSIDGDETFQKKKKKGKGKKSQETTVNDAVVEKDCSSHIYCLACMNDSECGSWSLDNGCSTDCMADDVACYKRVGNEFASTACMRYQLLARTGTGGIAAATEETLSNTGDDFLHWWDHVMNNKALFIGAIVGVSMLVMLVISAAIIGTRRRRRNRERDEFEGSEERPTIFYDEEGRQVIMAPRGANRYVVSAPTPTNAMWKKQASSTRSKKSQYTFSPKRIVDDDSPSGRDNKALHVSQQQKQWLDLQSEQMNEQQRWDNNWEKQQIAGAFSSNNKANCDSSVVGLVVHFQDDEGPSNNSGTTTPKEKSRRTYKSRSIPVLGTGIFGGQKKPPPMTPRRSYFHLDSGVGSPKSNAPDPPSHPRNAVAMQRKQPQQNQ